MFEGANETGVTELFTPEQLVQRRMDLHRELGKISGELCRIQQAYNGCIEDILQTNEELRTRGVDTGHLAYEISRIENQETA